MTIQVLFAFGQVHIYIIYRLINWQNCYVRAWIYTRYFWHNNNMHWRSFQMIMFANCADCNIIKTFSSNLITWPTTCSCRQTTQSNIPHIVMLSNLYARFWSSFKNSGWHRDYKFCQWLYTDGKKRDDYQINYDIFVVLMVKCIKHVSIANISNNIAVLRILDRQWKSCAIRHRESFLCQNICLFVCVCLFVCLYVCFHCSYFCIWIVWSFCLPKSK